MKQVTFSFLLAINALTSNVMAEESPAYSEEGFSRFTVYPGNEETGIRKVNEKTEFMDLGYRGLLLKLESRSEYFHGREGSTDTVKIIAKSNSQGQQYRDVWSLTAEGSEVKVDEDLVLIDEFQCCGGQDVTRVYDLLTGKKIEATLNSSLVELSVPNSKLAKRYLAQVIDSKAPQEVDGSTYVGTISYFSKEQIKQRVRLYADLPGRWGADLTDLEVEVMKPDVYTKARNGGLSRLELWSSDGEGDPVEAYSNIALVGKIYYDDKEEEFTIFINSDSIMKTTVSGGLIAVPVNF
jgi:hypothetical protein